MIVEDYVRKVRKPKVRWALQKINVKRIDSGNWDRNKNGA